MVVGGGPTGVEMAGAIAELAQRALASDFRTIDPRATRIILVEAGPAALAAFRSERCREAARRSLEQLGVEVRLERDVTDCDCRRRHGRRRAHRGAHHHLGGGREASPAGSWLGAETDRAGRVMVEPDLTVPGHPDIFVIGDAAPSRGRDGKPLPGVAPVAKQQGTLCRRAAAGARSQARACRRSAIATTGPWRRSGASAPSCRSAGFR